MKPIKITVTLTGSIDRDYVRKSLFERGSERVVTIEWDIEKVHSSMVKALAKALKLKGAPRVGGASCLLVNTLICDK